MKKIIAAVLSVAAALMLCGCRPDAPSDTAVQTPNVTPEAVITIAPNSPAAVIADSSYNTPNLTLELSQDHAPTPKDTYTEIHTAVNAENYFDYTLKRIVWTETADPADDHSEDCTSVTLRGDGWSLTACNKAEAVWFIKGDYSAWYLPTMDGSPFDVYSVLRQWVDEAEYIPMAEALSVPDSGQDHEKAAKEYMERLDALHMQVTEGSKYRYSYVKSIVTVNEIAEEMTAALRDQRIIGNNEFCFAVDIVFVPENEAALAWNMAGNTTPYQGTDPKVPEDALQKNLCGIIANANGQWTLTHIGTSW